MRTNVCEHTAKMASLEFLKGATRAGEIVSIRGQVMEYTYISTGIKRELVRSGLDCDWKG